MMELSESLNGDLGLQNFRVNCEFTGVEQHYGTVEWTTGVECWTGLLECHTHEFIQDPS